MSHPHQHEPQAMPQGTPLPRATFAAPRLELPRFQFRPGPLPPGGRDAQATLARPAAAAQSAPAQPVPAQPVPAQPAPAPLHAAAHGAPPTYAASGYATPQPMIAPTLQPAAVAPSWQATATATASPVAVATVPAPPPAARPTLTPAATAMANATSHASSIAWSPVEPTGERSLLQRVSPVHMGVLMVLVMVMLVMTSGPAAMTAKPARLPAAVVDGGGTAGGVPLPTRAGTTAVAAASNAGADAAPATSAAPVTAAGTPVAKPRTAPRTRPAATRRARMLKVGSAHVRAGVRAGGIPSPAASANLAVAGGGRVARGQTGAVRMSGIPSAAASEQLGPQTLAFRPDDGVTLPRATGERDSHALDSHYGATDLPMEEPVAAPAMTPGQAAAQAERHVTMQQLSGGSATPPAHVAGGASWSF